MKPEFTIPAAFILVLLGWLYWVHTAPLPKVPFGYYEHIAHPTENK